MSRLVSLICKGCSLRLSSSLFDDDKNRSCYGKCHHSLCLQCVSENPEQDCPLCGEPNAFEHKTIDYTSCKFYEDLLNRPTDIIRDLWNGETVDTGRCALCREERRDLRVCIKCEMKLPKWERCIDGISIDSEGYIPDYKYEFRVRHYSMLPDFYNRVYCSDCVLDRPKEIEERNRERYKTFHKWEKGSETVKLRDLKNYDVKVKLFTIAIAKKLLWKSLNKMKKRDFCKLRYWRFLRTFEAFMFFSNKLWPSPRSFIFSWNSKHSKFFKGFENVGTSDSSEKIVEKLMRSLEVQLEEMKKIQKKCECTEIYQKMHKWKCGNSVDQNFVKMVESVDFEDVSISECLLKTNSQLYEDLQKCHKKAEEMFQWKLHLIPTVVCWSKTNDSCGFCCLFNDKNGKPYKCWNCEHSICAECWKDENIKCPDCGIRIRDAAMKVNTGIIELVNFYKKNCVDLYEKWWNSEPVPFCLNCYSYSPQLEICAFCELSEVHSSLKCNADHNADFQFKNVRLTNLLLRIQCSHCLNRFRDDWDYQNCEQAQESSQLSFRGCNHLRSRFCRECRVNKFTSQKNPFNAIALNSIDNFKHAWKLATIEILHQILKSAVEDLNICKLRKMRFLNIVEELDNRTNEFLNLGILGNLVNENEHLEGIQKTVDILKFQWTELQGDDENCRCKVLWDRESSEKELWELFKTAASFQLDQKLEGCPLEFNHGFKTSPEDDFFLEFHNLWNN